MRMTRGRELERNIERRRDGARERERGDAVRKNASKRRLMVRKVL